MNEWKQRTGNRSTTYRLKRWCSSKVSDRAIRLHVLDELMSQLAQGMLPAVAVQSTIRCVDRFADEVLRHHIVSALNCVDPEPVLCRCRRPAIRLRPSRNCRVDFLRPVQPLLPLSLHASRPVAQLPAGDSERIGAGRSANSTVLLVLFRQRADLAAQTRVMLKHQEDKTLWRRQCFV